MDLRLCLLGGRSRLGESQSAGLGSERSLVCVGLSWSTPLTHVRSGGKSVNGMWSKTEKVVCEVRFQFPTQVVQGNP